MNEEEVNTNPFCYLHTPTTHTELFQIWGLADIDMDGALDSDEFSVAMFLAESVRDGGKIPTVLPPDLVPPSKRG